LIQNVAVRERESDVFKKEGLFVIEKEENPEFSGFCERENDVGNKINGFRDHRSDVFNQKSNFQDSGSREMEKYFVPVIEKAEYFFRDVDIRDRENEIFD